MTAAGPEAAPPGGRARVYNRRVGAHGAGHVGWAFLVEDGLWEAGAVEKGGFITPPFRDGFWSQTMVDPNPRMGLLRYDSFKEFDVQAPTPGAARAAEAVVSKRWFNLVIHNCMQDTYRVLRAYGAILPPIDRRWDWKPNAWYALLPGDMTRL